MKISSYMLSLTGLFASFSVLADDDRQKIVEHLKTLQQQGLIKVEKYQLPDTKQLTQCVEESMYYREAAKQLQKMIMASNDVIFRMPAYQAADLAFQCVNCSDKAESYCQKMDKYIARAEKQLQK